MAAKSVWIYSAISGRSRRSSRTQPRAESFITTKMVGARYCRAVDSTCRLMAKPPSLLTLTQDRDSVGEEFGGAVEALRRLLPLQALLARRRLRRTRHLELHGALDQLLE